MNADVANLSFEFIRPLWLIGLLVLPALGWADRRFRGSSGWEDYIDPKKLRYLSILTPARRSWMRPILIASLALACLALAGPSWRTIPLPVKVPRDAMVIAFDLSPSMLAEDVSPSRLTRARLKLIDLLRLRKEGETALIVYADDAYRVSPLTDDASTIEALVPSLDPDVMPGPGSRVEAAVEMAGELFAGAAIERGVLLIITDGIDPSAIEAIEDGLGESIRLCILTVGGVEGVPIPIPSGGFARDARKQTILAGVNRSEIKALADRHGGCFAELRADDADLERILDRLGPDVGDDLDVSETTFDVRQDEGYWLVLLLLPIAVLGFRKNVLFCGFVLFPAATLSPSVSHALEWVDLWQRADQQEVREIESGIELYREGDYAGAAESFDGDSPIQHYNRGNALALSGQLEEALESYDQALAETPDDEAAQYNRDIVEKLIEQQQNDEESQQGDSGDSDAQDRESEDDSKSGDAQDQANDPSQPGDSGEPKPGDPSSDDSPSQDDAPEASDASDPQDESDPGARPEPSDEEETADSESSQASDASKADEQESDSKDAASALESGAEQEPLSDRSEQWLRNIPDDPGGLMRRKFEYQAQERRQRGARQRSSSRY